MATKVGINGFGRIGRNFFRAHLQRGGDFEVVAVNDLGDAKTMAHLLKRDSVLGRLEEDVEAGDGKISVGKNELQVLSVRDPKELPWDELGVELAIESTGLFTKREGAAKHLQAGAKKVVISAPATDPDVTVVDFVVRVRGETGVDEVKEAFRRAAASGPLGGILLYSDEPHVSSDI